MTSAKSEDTSKPGPASSPKRKRWTTHGFRWWVRMVLGIPLALLLVGLLLMRSPLVGWVVGGQVRKLTGSELRGTGATGAYIDVDGKLVLRDFSIELPSVNGEAAKFLSAERAVVELDWSDVLSGKVVPTTVRLTKPVFRVSQSTQNGTLNLQAIAPGAMEAVQGSGAGGSGSGKAGTTPVPPRIDVIDGVIQFAEHDASGKYSPLRELHVAGSFNPADAKKPVYAIRFSEVGKTQGGLLLDGKVDLSTGQSGLKLYNVALDAWTPESVPTAYRDLWRRLNVQGRIASASLTYDKAEGPRVEVTLEDVAMNALIPAEGSQPGQEKDMGLSGVSGVVRFSKAGLKVDVSGRIEGTEGQSRVVLTTMGTDLNAALTCEIEGKGLSLSKETQLLPYIPKRATEYLRVFGGPTGELDLRVVVSRGAPENGKAAEIRVSDGRAQVRNGTAAFARFAYPFHDMSGTFEFDDQHVKVVEITGKGPSGATMKATALVSPLTDESMVEVKLRAEGVPVDEHLLKAMPKDRRELLETIFNEKEYQRLLDEGLVRRPGTAGRSDPTVGLEPEFVVGGTCNVDLHVFTPRGKNAPWYTTVNVSFDEAGILAEPFPFPVLARNLKVKVTDDDAELISGELVPISGGTLDMKAKIVFFENDQRVIKPDVVLVADEIPVDRTLMFALPEALRPGYVAPKDPSLASANAGELLRRLNLGGSLSAVARVVEAKPGAPKERVEYHVSVDLGKARSRPALYGEDPPFSIEDLTGTMEITRESLKIFPLEARMFPSTSAGFVGPQPSANFAVRLDRKLGGAGEDEGAMDAHISITQIDLSEPVEKLVAVFSPDAGERLGSLRETRVPTGRLNSSIVLSRAAGETSPTSVAITLDNASNIEFSALDGRLGVDWPEGSIGVQIPSEGPQGLSFEGVSARLTLNGVYCGTAGVNGFLSLDPQGEGVRAPADLVAEFKDWRFESALLRPLVTALTSKATSEKYAKLNAAGPFDAVVKIGNDGDVDPKKVSPARVEAELVPESFAADMDGVRITAHEMSGQVTLRTLTGDAPAPVSGRFDGVEARTDTWIARVNGTWSTPAFAPAPGKERPVTLDVAFDVEALKLDDTLKVLMPEAALQTLRGLEADFAGPVVLSEATVKTALGEERNTIFNGRLAFQDLKFNVGMPIDRCDGRVSIMVDNRAGMTVDTLDRPTKFKVDFEAERLRAAGIQVRNARAGVESGERAGEIRVPQIEAQCHGGRMTGSAQVQIGIGSDEAGNELVGKTTYDSDFTLAGVRLAAVLADLATSGATDPGPVGPPNPFTEPDPSRGMVDARVSVSGTAGELASRRGEGAIRVSNGDVLKIPVMLPLIQVSNFQLPSKDRLSYLQSDFVIRGERADFEHISLLSKSVAIVGQGTLTWPGLNLDMRFNSKGMTRVPLLSDLFEALRDEIVSTTVTGTLSAPVVKAEPFTGTRKMLDDLFNPKKRSSRLDAIETGKAARQEEERHRDAAEATVMPDER